MATVASCKLAVACESVQKVLEAEASTYSSVGIDLVLKDLGSGIMSREPCPENKKTSDRTCYGVNLSIF
jgi:hypothetical protein